MVNLQQFKNEILSTIPEVKRALKLKREANKRIAEIEKLIDGSYCENGYNHHLNLNNFETHEVIEKACSHLRKITNDTGLKELVDYISLGSGYNGFKTMHTYFTNLKMIKNITLNDLLEQVTDFVQTDSDYCRSEYTINNNKIKYAMNKSWGGVNWQRLYYKMLDVIQLYEIAINDDIADKTILEKLHEATFKNKLDQVQYKNIKIKVFQNGNYEITFADKTELEKVFNAINETIERRNRKEK